MDNKIIRSICYFTNQPTEATIETVEQLAKRAENQGFEIQTKRICSPRIDLILKLSEQYSSEEWLLSIGSQTLETISQNLPNLAASKDINFNLDLTAINISQKDVELLFKIIKINPKTTFNFTYTFTNPASSPFFPSGNYQKDGFSIGLQATDLSENCQTLDEWLDKMKIAWAELVELFARDVDCLGIDSSVAPLFTGISSFIYFIKKLGMDFAQSTTTDTYLKITNFIKTQNPKPVGLCGLMLPALEDFDLANEYENGNFPVERNLYLSLQSGVGIDTYPIGIDESPKRVLEILKLTQGLAAKHNKPLSIRLVSDGKTKIGQKTDFQNQYLKDVVVRPL